MQPNEPEGQGDAGPNGIRIVNVMTRPPKANPKSASEPNKAPPSITDRAARQHQAPAATISLASPAAGRHGAERDTAARPRKF
jgi:hypothetical protein